MQDFTKEYSLNNLIPVVPKGTNFSMMITPRFINHYENREYEKWTSLLIKNFAKTSNHFLDIGAHYGYFSLLANEANNNINIRAIEPILENNQILSINLHKVTSKENIINLAISNEKGKKEFHKSMASDNCGFLEHPNAETIEKIKVNVDSLDNLFYEKLDGSILIKVDTEGNELDVLKGMTKLLETVEDIKLILEINPKMLTLAKSSPEIIFQFLQERDFSIYVIDDEKNNLFKLDNLDWKNEFSDYSYFNIFAVRKQIERNICFFSHSSELGGAERSLLDLIEILVSKGVICSVVMPGEGPLKKEFERIGVTVKSINSMAWWASLDDTNYCKISIVECIKNNFNNILAFVKKISPDAIYSQTIVSPIGAMVAEELDIPHFFSIREYGEKDHNLHFCFGFKNSINAISNTSANIFAISHSTKKDVLENNYQEKCIVNYSKVNLQEDFLVPKYKIINKEFVKIGIFGSIVEGKNQKDGINAVLSLLEKGYKIELYLVGNLNQEYFIHLNKIINNTCFSENIKFINFSENVETIMNKMDIVLSCAKSEALGRTLIEAILLKIPIIYGNSAGPKEIYKNDIHGLAYEVGNIEELIQQIVTTIENQDKTNQRVEKSFSYIKNFFTDERYSQPLIDALINLKKNKYLRKEKYVSKFIMSNLSPQDFVSFREKRILFSQLFIEGENGFSEENSIRFSVLENNKSQIFKFDLKDKINLKSLRFDPLNNYCTIKINKILINEEVYDCFLDNNAFYKENNTYYFNTDDSQIFLNISKYKVIRSISFDLQYIHIGTDTTNQIFNDFARILKIKEQNIQNLNQELNQKEQNIQNLNQELEDKNQNINILKEKVESIKLELTSIYTSKSWKITKPLRQIMMKLKK